jgi:hypothetical protein
MGHDFSSLHVPVPWYERVLQRLKVAGKLKLDDLATSSRIDYHTRRLLSARRNLYLLGLLVFLNVILMVLGREMTYGKYRSSMVWFVLISASSWSLSERLRRLRIYRRHFHRSVNREESEEEFQGWVASFRQREVKTGGAVFRILIALMLLHYLLG